MIEIVVFGAALFLVGLLLLFALSRRESHQQLKKDYGLDDGQSDQRVDDLGIEEKDLKSLEMERRRNDRAAEL